MYVGMWWEVGHSSVTVSIDVHPEWSIHVHQQVYVLVALLDHSEFLGVIQVPQHSSKLSKIVASWSSSPGGQECYSGQDVWAHSLD